MDNKTETMTEQELERTADELLAASDIKDAPKKKSTRRTKIEEKPAEEQDEVKTTEDILDELMEKAKKSGKISTKEIAALEEKGVDAESITKFYDALEANKIDIDISADDAVPILDDIDMPEIEELNEIEEVTEEEMAEVIGKLPALRRRFLLSATDAEEIPRFTGMNRTLKLDFLNPEETVSQRLSVYRVTSPVKDKLETLYKLLCTLGNESTLVFCNHRESVDRVGKYLHSMKVYCETFHGGMEQDDRERALYKFRNGSCHIFISTDLAARGLDIPDIRHVVHYHLPVAEDGFIHRNGRTARWEAEGNAFLILHDEERIPDYVPRPLEEFELPEPTPQPALPEFVTLYIGKGKKDKINKIDIVGFLSKKGGLGRDDVGRVDVKDHYAFAAISRKKAKQMLKLIQNEKIKGVKTLIELAK